MRENRVLDLLLTPPDGSESLARWLYNALKSAILTRRLVGGQALPSTRSLSERYGVSRGTVISAFEELKAEGYLVSRQGSATRVSQVLPDSFFEASTQRVASRLSHKPSEPIRLPHLKPLGNLAPGPIRPFRANQPATDLFPIEIWNQTASRRMRLLGNAQLLGCPALGYGPLRQEVAEYLRAARGVSCADEQVVIVTGTQQALDLAVRLTLQAGDAVVVENPGYDGATRLFTALGHPIIPGPLDGEGLILDAETFEPAKLIYTTPGHQFPTGVTMSLARRMSLLNWARTQNRVILEDDYDSEFRYASRPIPALQGLDSAGKVMLIGSFSKLLFPGLRLGYLVLPHTYVDAAAAWLSLMHRHGPILDQAILADFIAKGHFGRHLHRMRKVYAERLDVLLTSAKQRLDGMLTLHSVEAGLQTVGWLPPFENGAHVSQILAQNQIETIALSRFSPDGLAHNGLQLGFAALTPNQIRDGVAKLAQSLESIIGKRS